MKKNRNPEHSFPDYHYQHPLVPHTIEFKVEDLFPGAKIELAIGDGDHGFPTHDGSLKMRIGVVLEAVVLVLCIHFAESTEHQYSRMKKVITARIVK